MKGRPPSSLPWVLLGSVKTGGASRITRLGVGFSSGREHGDEVLPHPTFTSAQAHGKLLVLIGILAEGSLRLRTS